MNDQTEFARQVRKVLDQSLDTLPPGVNQRLFEARQVALQHRRVAVLALGATNIGEIVDDRLFGFVRAMLAVCALSLGLAGSYYWNSFEKAAENEEIDSALLADELPPSAYLDRGFHRWIESEPQPQASSLE